MESFNYSEWSGAELARAEATASRFLDEKHKDIARVLETQCAVLEHFVSALRGQGLTLEQRLDYFARISEISQGIRDCAEGFFELGSQPLVARMLAKA